MMNCAAPEGERHLIRAPTTSEFIKELYESMAATLREDTAAASLPTSPPPPPPQQHSMHTPAPLPASLDPLDPAPFLDPAHVEAVAASLLDTLADAASSISPKQEDVVVVRPSNARKRWVEQVDAGRVLYASELEEMGAKGLSVYLRAMGEKVDRGSQSDAKAMRAMLRAKLASLRVLQWAKVARAEED